MPYRLSSFLVLLLCLSACSDSHWHPDPASSDAKTLKIAVFGSSSGNEQNYSASTEAAKLAQDNEDVKALQGYVTIEPREDAQSLTEAIEDARRIRDDPDVLAVVGHSYSGTTHAALPIYEQAGIPVMMPTATSPYVMYKFDEHRGWPGINELANRERPYPRFHNAFRLIPSDVPSQVEAIEATTRRSLHLNAEDDPNPKPGSARPGEQRRIMLICDVTKRNGANVYTQPICESLFHDSSRHSIAKYIARYRQYDVDTVDVWAMVTEIHAVLRSETSKQIVFVGYPEMARMMLEELTERSSAVSDNMKSYTFIMSEACLSNELLQFGATIYVTSPYNRSHLEECLPQLAQVAHDKNVVLSAEGYAYDAIVIVAKAAKACKAKNQLGRECVLDYLQENGDNLPGKCEQYWIGNGERKAAPYYVYTSCRGELTKTGEIGTEHDIYEKWPCKHSSK